MHHSVGRPALLPRAAERNLGIERRCRIVHWEGAEVPRPRRSPPQGLRPPRPNSRGRMAQRRGRELTNPVALRFRAALFNSREGAPFFDTDKRHARADSKRCEQKAMRNRLTKKQNAAGRRKDRDTKL